MKVTGQDAEGELLKVYGHAISEAQGMSKINIKGKVIKIQGRLMVK